MKNRIENITGMYLVIFLALTLLLTGSCNKNRKSQSGYGKIIPEKNLESILKDIYLADGLQALPDIRNKFAGKDSVLSYIDIIESHGYSYHDMNQTIKYYFIKKPKKLLRIYDQVLAELSQMQTIYEKVSLETSQDNLSPGTTGRSNAIFREDGSEKTAFNHSLRTNGVFTLHFSVTVYPEDQSVNPCFTAWTCNADSSETGKRTYLPSFKYLKDGLIGNFVITGDIRTQYPVVLKGYYVDFENNPAGIIRHTVISRTSFSFTGAPL